MSAEQHVYPPPAEAVKGAWVSGMAAYQALVAEAEPTTRATGRAWRAS